MHRVCDSFERKCRAEERIESKRNVTIVSVVRLTFRCSFSRCTFALFLSATVSIRIDAGRRERQIAFLWEKGVFDLRVHAWCSSENIQQMCATRKKGVSPTVTIWRNNAMNECNRTKPTFERIYILLVFWLFGDQKALFFIWSENNDISQANRRIHAKFILWLVMSAVGTLAQ